MSFNIPGMTATQERAIFTAGLALQGIQIAELNLNSILTWHFPKRAPVDLATLSAMSTANLKSTLGQIFTALRKRADIDSSFDAVLERFVTNRNRFAHRLFTEDDCELATDEGARNAIAFMEDLLRDASTVNRTVVSFMVCLARASNDPNLKSFANEMISSPERPYDIIAGSETVFRTKPCNTSS